MESNPNDYHISFFKPATEMARLNRNIIISLVIIWTVTIFGFQIVLKVISKPTPEPAYLAFEKVWDKVSSGKASDTDLQVFAQASLSVLGKNFIDPGHKKALDNGLSWSIQQLAGAEKGATIRQDIAAFEKLKGEIENITDPQYVKARNELASTVSTILGLTPGDVRTTLVSNELNSSMMDALSPESREAIPAAMALYLIHPQSFLTDGRFLGFPFHYFYTAVFLLVLFVGLCWLYCVRADRRDIILGIDQ
jgi:putative solute:sodium symporter small subunit